MMMRTIGKIVLIALCVSVSGADAPPLTREYIIKFRQDNPQRAHWTDADICDHVAAQFPDNPDLARWARARAKEREDRIAADSKWEVRSLLPWERPPISVVLTRKQMKGYPDSTVGMPTVVVANRTRKAISAIEVLLKIDGELHRRLICEQLGPEESMSFFPVDIFGRMPVYGRTVRFICSGFKGSVDVKMEFD